jgi:hypothetical protein
MCVNIGARITFGVFGTGAIDCHTGGLFFKGTGALVVSMPTSCMQ